MSRQSYKPSDTLDLSSHGNSGASRADREEIEDKQFRQYQEKSYNTNMSSYEASDDGVTDYDRYSTTSSGKALPDVHTSIKVHHAPGGRSQCPFGTDKEPSTPSRSKFSQSNSSQMAQSLGTPGDTETGRYYTSSTSNKVQMQKFLADQVSMNESNQDMQNVTGKALPDVHTSVKVFHAPGGGSSMGSILSQSSDSQQSWKSQSNKSHDIFNLSPERSYRSKSISSKANEESNSAVKSDAPYEAHSFRTGRANESGNLPNTNPDKPHTSVRMYQAPGGRSSGNIISWQ